MTKGQRRAEQRRRRSHFERADLASAMRGDIRAELPKKRLIVEPNWHLRSEPKEPAPVVITNR